MLYGKEREFCDEIEKYEDWPDVFCRFDLKILAWVGKLSYLESLSGHEYEHALSNNNKKIALDVANCLLIKHKSKLYHFTKEGTIHIQFHLFRWNHPYLTSLTEALSDLSTLLIHASSMSVRMWVRQKDKS